MKGVFGHGVLVVFAVLFAVLYAVTAFAEYKRVEIPLDGSPSRGPSNARVVIVEFLDYQ